jgi:hypothetical protein
MYPNIEPLYAGRYVENVHPCATYSDGGIVLGTVENIGGADYVSVRTGKGGTCYGPAANWAPTEREPDWSRRLKARCFCPDDCNCHHPWRTNVCGCRQH